MSFFIVSGLSGSGKTIALQALEDIGFYCIDNLPAVLLPHFSGLLADMRNNAIMNVAIGMDVRNRAFLADLPKSLERLRTRGIHYRIIFLEAEDSDAGEAFQGNTAQASDARQSHAAARGIRLEKKLLEPLSFDAALRIDTTHTTPHELRTQVQRLRARRGYRGTDPAVRILRLQARHAARRRLRLRCALPAQSLLADRTAALHRSGRAGGAISSNNTTRCKAMFEEICGFLEKWLPRFEREDRSYMTIAIGCTGGQHRSVYLVREAGGVFFRQEHQDTDASPGTRTAT